MAQTERAGHANANAFARTGGTSSVCRGSSARPPLSRGPPRTRTRSRTALPAVALMGTIMTALLRTDFAFSMHGPRRAVKVSKGYFFVPHSGTHSQGLVENDTDAPVGLRLEGLSLSLGDGKLVLISDPHWTHHQCYCPKPILQANIKLVKEVLRHEGAASQSPRRRPPAGTQHASTAAAGSRGSPQGAPRFRRPPVLHARRCGGLQARAGAGSQAADAAIAGSGSLHYTCGGPQVHADARVPGAGRQCPRTRTRSRELRITWSDGHASRYAYRERERVRVWSHSGHIARQAVIPKPPRMLRRTP